MGKQVYPERVALLRDVPLFSGLSDAELQRVASAVDDVDLPAGKELMREGDVGHESFIIAAGDAEVQLGGKTIAKLGPGAFVGEMALLDLRPRASTVTAITDMRLLALSSARFSDLLAIPGVAVRLLKMVVERLREVEQRLVV